MVNRLLCSCCENIYMIVIGQNPRFFQLLARNVLQLSPPIGFFGNFVVESVGENKKAFDIKSSMMPIVDYARIYALQHNIAATNTFERLKQLYERNLLSQPELSGDDHRHTAI